VEILEEESYFFRLSKYQEPLLNSTPTSQTSCSPEPDERGAILRGGGLKDLSISRTTITWGIPFPDEPQHILYVWLDALSNYMTALGFGSGDQSLYDRYWPADVHLIGKDILRFHAVYWPAFLMSAGLPLPDHVFGHGWWMKDANKMSKSLGNIVDPGPSSRNSAPTRCATSSCATSHRTDGSFSDEAFIDRINADLANDLGNLASRLSNLLEKQAGGAVDRGRDAAATFRADGRTLSRRHAGVSPRATPSRPCGTCSPT